MTAELRSYFIITRKAINGSQSRFTQAHEQCSTVFGSLELTQQVDQMDCTVPKILYVEAVITEAEQCLPSGGLVS